jgi:hypothetical protein
MYFKFLDMLKLKSEWLTDGIIDFEYKKYILLAYFKDVRMSFNKVELYPFLSDIISHYQNLQLLKNEKDSIKSKFPQTLDKLDLNKLELVYKQMMDDDEIMKELESIVEYALPIFKNSLEEGKEIYEFVEKNCEVSPVGLLPLYTDEGYFFLGNADNNISIHRYNIMRLKDPKNKYRAINTSLVMSVKKGIGSTFENMKIELIKKYKDLPNPATYLIYSKLKFPYNPTLMPIAKRLLIKHISLT